jgi:hypothetical protein
MRIIPKKIHYCWFGRGDMPKLALKCIESWKRILPDYQIKRWDENNFDININEYVRQAYRAKKYAFVTDYVRLYALYSEGGIYMDTDVEVLKSLDKFLHHEVFTGFESSDKIQTGLIGAKPQNSWIKENLLVYENKGFIKADGSYDMKTNVILITEMSKKMGFKKGNEFQIFGDGVAIYPTEYFCPIDYRTNELNLTNNTYAIHHFAGSWLPWRQKIKVKVRKIVGKKNYDAIKKTILNISNQ